jgi:hypothetical protein
MKKAMVTGIAGVALLVSVVSASAFDIKGFKSGMNVADIDTQKCEKVPNADSGIPGYACNTTLGGDQALARLAVFDEKLVAAVFTVNNGQFRPMLDALSEKFGRPSQPNRFLEEYQWAQGREILSLKQNLTKTGYRVLIMDLSLYNQAKDVQKEKAKKDL